MSRSSSYINTNNNKKKLPPRIKVSRPDPDGYKNYTFQHPANAMRLTVRAVDLSHRVAFDSRIPPGADSASLRRMLDEMDRVRGSRSAVGSVIEVGNRGKKKSTDNPCRISPSPNHVAILEFVHGSGRGVVQSSQMEGRDGGRRVVRQLHWNPACSVDADPWFDGRYDGDGDGDEHNTSATEHGTRNASLDRSRNNGGAKQSHEGRRGPMRRKPKSSHGDGRYVPIDPLAATKSAMPDHSPILTNYKRRLPLRSDVGFSNPSPEEVQRKMAEVKREAEWEEASPRIVLLASGFALFGDGDEEADELHPSCQSDARLWAGGSLPGVPFAGRDLVSAYRAAAACFEGREDSESKKRRGTDDVMLNPRAYSVFAPPVDATFSASHLWRPRPFADRPPGHVYFLACPLDVRFDEGDVEPLFCTMTLYSLPRSLSPSHPVDEGGNSEIASNNAFCGKISEDFFFPAGDWSSIDGVDAAVDEDDEEDDEWMQQSWRRRKRRAIMSYDPLEVKAEDLHLVVQVFRAGRPSDSKIPNASTDRSKKSFGSKIKRSLLAGKARDVGKNRLAMESMQSASRSNEDLLNNPLSSFEEAGVQYSTPVCFGVTRAFDAGDERQKQLSAYFFSFPDAPESQEDFVERLASLVSQSDCNTDLAPVGGHADVFTSQLGGDFTRALLDEPPRLYNALDDAAPEGPQLLADVMGDCAICFDGPGASDGAVKRRSGLRRLPPSRDSGYSSSFDLKEVLYFPPRSPTRKYEEDATLCASTILNLLYIYPRWIRWSSSGTNKGSRSREHLSLRVQVVEQELPMDQSFDGLDPFYHALQAIYNPSSPAGPPLVESFYTKLINLDIDDKREGKTKTSRKEIPLKDEIKVRLPEILDRRHFLQFSLFSVRGQAGAELVVETTIPFIISSKESTSGARVTTIIPNGLHRIQLGEGLQIHVETRLASSSHVSDASVATLLRDYPIAQGAAVSEGAAGEDADSGSLNSDVIVHASSGLPFVDILAMASGQAVRRHFLSLMNANMLNLVNRDCPPFYFESLFDMFGSDSAWHRLVAWEKTDQFLSIIRMLFDLLDKTRTSYQERDRSMVSLQYQRLVKSFLDTFDEPLFMCHQSGTNVLDAENGDSVGERNFHDSLDSSYYVVNDSSYYDEPSSALGETRVPKYKFSSPRNNIISPRSFSRSAFVATRSEQLKAEMELNDDEMYGRDYLDDDETVVTLGTITSRIDSGSVFPVIMETKSFTVGQDGAIQTKSSTVGTQEETSSDWTCGSGIPSTPPRQNSPIKTRSSTPFSFASKRAEYMANRVNTMAQLVMAPCIAPSSDDMISDGVDVTPRHSVNVSSSNGKFRVTSNIASYGGTGNRTPFESSSDAEEEGDAPRVSHHLRGNQSCLKIPPLTFHPMRDSGDSSINGEKSYHLYEIILALWVQAWTSNAASMKSDSQVQGSSNTIPTWPYELVQGNQIPTGDAAVAFSFIRHMHFFLPLCLKSLGLRCAQLNTTKLIVPMTFLDDSHMHVLLPFVETIALGLMREALSGSSGIANSDQMLSKALSNSDNAMDFIVGLFALIHPSQVSTLLFAYFNILEESENPSGEKMSKYHLRRSKCARQIRLHAVERLAAIPTFSRLNFPLKFTGSYPRRKLTPSSWTNQKMSHQTEEDPLQKYWETVDRFPQSFWLSELLITQCFSICQSSCDTIIVEAKKQSKAMKRGRKLDDALLRDDLLRMESLAFHSILCAYELLIKRQAMDFRFQTIASSTRTAALFTRPVLQQSVDAASRLSRMDPDQKVRLIWLLCLLYILQEGPDAMIREELLRMCNSEDNRINNFVHLLKLASISCQHFIPGDESILVLGGLSKEMTQEAFNCLSASVILLIDECFDVVAQDKYHLERLGISVFDLLLHLLSTPQSSVTLLRTLGGSAHALDKFGVPIFLKAVGNQLQHWARIVLTMMNSMELSVRSIAVDFLVSLLCDIYQELGTIDSVSLCILSVAPEVVAREIALCSVSGLIKSMEAAESSVWPLRRALADVEETNPLDDDRVDPQLLPSLITLCRTSQAIIDSVLVEVRLSGSSNLDLNEMAKAQRTSPATDFRQLHNLPSKTVFDADEESVLEAACFFSPETSITQKLRWLYTLRDLHIAKKKWTEVAETLIICAHSLIKSLDHLSTMWRPSVFDLWNDSQRSPWLSSVGSSDGRSGGNVPVMRFANAFLDPGVFIHQREPTMTQHSMSVEGVCTTLISVLNQAEDAYAEEDGMEDIACSHFEELLNMITAALNHEGKRYRLEVAALRRVRATIFSKLAKLTEHDVRSGFVTTKRSEFNGVYVRVILSGSKPKRFKESTTIPTYFEWEIPSICRVSKPTLIAASQMKQTHPEESWEECVCQTFAMPLIEALRKDDNKHAVILRTKECSAAATDETEACISVMVVQKKSSAKSRKFFVRHGLDTVTEYTVAHKFPYALSRQRALISSEIKVPGQKIY